MHQETRSAHDRAGVSSDLSGYGDLSSFDPQATRRSKDIDEQSAIDRIMGGEDFHVGDGTLEFKLRDEDRDLLPSVRPVSPDVRLALPERAERDFAPIENGFPDPGDEVARNAVVDALSRLESLAGEHTSHKVVSHDDEETTSAELSEERADDLLSGGGFGGMGSDHASDAPTPFALPKLPGSFEPYVPPVSEAILTSRDVEEDDQPYVAPARSASIPSEVSFDRSRATMRSFEDESEVAPARVVHHMPVVESQTEEFAPFDLRAAEKSAGVETFDTGSAEVPSYARANDKKIGMSAAESDLDDFLPPSTETPRAAAQARPVKREIPPPPAYSQPRSLVRPRDVEEDQLEDHFTARDTDPEPPVTEAHEPEASEVPQVESPAAPARPSLFAQYRNILLAVVLGAVLVGVKYFTKAPAQEAPEAVSETPPAVSAPIEREYSRAPIDESISGLLPPVTQPTLPTAASVDKTRQNVLEGPASEPKPATPGPALEAKLAEITERMNALETERDKLRNENVALKKKPAPAKPKKPAVVKQPEVKAEPAPVRKPLQNIQYLGTFRDGDRLVAEVLIDGSLARVKRGDPVVGNRRVDAIGDMSVTIDDVLYTP